jgi:hypothetical protein
VEEVAELLRRRLVGIDLLLGDVGEVGELQGGQALPELLRAEREEILDGARVTRSQVADGAAESLFRKPGLPGGAWVAPPSGIGCHPLPSRRSTAIRTLRAGRRDAGPDRLFQGRDTPKMASHCVTALRRKDLRHATAV